MNDPLPDEELAELVRDGQGDLWPELVERVLRMVRPIVHQQIPEADREDVAQNVLMRLVTALPSYSPRRARLRTFVAVLTRRQLIDHYRWTGRQPELKPIEWALHLPEAACVSANPAPDLVAAMERIIGADDTKAVLMFAVEGYSYREIGVHFGIRGGAAKMRVRRAEKRLREAMGDKDV